MTAELRPSSNDPVPGVSGPDVSASVGLELTALVVDDSRAQLKTMAMFLKRWGYTVIEASSGTEALDVVRMRSVDLILSDWMMPGMTGPEFCEQFRQLESEAYTYFILLTSKTEKHEVAQGLAAGADDFLSKPVNVEELRARIAAGARIQRMQSELSEKNRLLSSALDELQGFYDAVDRDLIEARNLQQSLVPERFRHFNRADVSLLLRPSGHVGGDLVGVFRVSETRIGIYSIDVSGHGIASALMTARIAGFLTGASPDKNVALTIDDFGLYSMRATEDVCADLNRMMLEEMETEHYFTMVIADCNLRTGEVRMTQAGHPNPLIQRADGSTHFVGEGGLPIGLIPGAEFTSFTVKLAPGDRLLVFSDGFTECPVPGGLQLEDEGLADLVEQNADVRGTAFLEALIWDASILAGGEDFPDDVSGFLLEYTGVSEQVT